jgi:L-alanine-DL-glutamate epimerase-like enolase superfamily enzyme
MPIATVEVIAIRAPRKETVRAADGSAPVAASEFGIVRIVTDDGVEGVGASARSRSPRRGSASASATPRAA